MSLTLGNWRERVRASLFFVPAMFIVGALAAIVLTAQLDGRFPELLEELPLLRTSSAESTRQVLSTVASATITVAGIVFSVTVVAVQLTSSQFSPRVLHGFLRDRFDQNTIGLVVATFVYCLIALVTTPTAAPGQAPGAEIRDLTVTVAVVLGIASILAIVAFIDHSARSMQVGHIIRSISDDTRDRIDSLLPERGEEPPQGLVADHEPDEGGFVVRSTRDGWVQRLDHDRLLGWVPADGVGRVDVRTGVFVAEGTPLMTIWPPPGEPDATIAGVQDGIVIGRTRTMQQDIAFGIRQLVDIALRALSPGVNDPTTAYDVLANLGAVLADLLQHDLPSTVLHGDDGRILLRPHELDHERYLGRAFDQIRVAGADQPAIGISMLRIIARLDELLAHRGIHELRQEVRDHARHVVDTFERARPDDPDAAVVRRVADSLGLLAHLGTGAAEDGPTSTESRADDDDS